MAKLIVILIGFLLLSGCVSLPQGPQPNDPDFAPAAPVQQAQEPVLNGAIYQAQNSPFYFEDRKARRVGDILTIRLLENTTAKKETETEIKKESTTNVAEPTLFQRITDIGLQTTLDSEIDFKGEADSDQKNSLQGSISVTVTEVLNNGALRIRGEKWITLNRGDEYIRISGIVRSDDIGPDNSVASTQVADARIAYSQTGELAHANRMGWLTRFFNSPLWPL